MAVDRQREYETIYILRPDSNDEQIASVRKRMQGVLESFEGHLLKFDDWGQRELAYEIRDSAEARRYDRGLYHYYRFMGPADTVAELERNLRLLDPVLKFMTVKLDDDLIPEERLNRPEEPAQEEAAEQTTQAEEN